MRIHLLGIPSTQTTREYSLCGFCQATIRFAKILRMMGHTVFLYASEENDAPCDELITCITKEEQETLLGSTPYQYAANDNVYSLWALSNPRMIAEIGKRKKPQDIICTIGGTSQKPVTDAHQDLLDVEYSIGYVSSYSRYRVYESHVWRHCTHGFQDSWEGRFYDDVIPLFFDESEFELNENKEGFLLYVGRLVPRKGLTIACQVAEAAGIPLKVIGHGDPSLVTNGAEYLGALPTEEKNRWMGRASALICPTQYIEPFGAVAVDAQLCGTPVISTDFGGFTETVVNGLSGYRCNYMMEFLEAIKNLSSLEPDKIRNNAVSRYSLESVSIEYEKYFKKLSTLFSKGWYSLT